MAYNELDTTEDMPLNTEKRAELTVADGLFLLPLILGGVLRLVNLGVIPLSPTEAANAISAWQLWQPAAMSAAAATSSAYVSLTGLLLPILGGSDAIARLVPALAGMGILLLPWLLRQRLGPIGTLVAGLLLAFSPTLVLASRTADGSTLGLLAGGLLLVAWLRYQETGEQRWLYAAAAALALGLTSAPLFYGLLLTLGLAYLAQAKFGPPIFYTEQIIAGDEEVEIADELVYVPVPTRWPEKAVWRNAAAVLGVLLLGLSTLFLWHLPGLGITGNLPAAWLGQINFQSDLFLWVEPILAVGRYEIILLLLGLVAIGWATWTGEPFPTFFIYWFTGILLLIFIQRGNLDNVLLLVLPGYLLVGLFADALWRIPAPDLRWLLAALVFLLGLMAYINLHNYLRLINPESSMSPNVWRAAVLVAVILTSTIYLARFQPVMVLQGVLAGILPLLLLYTWGTGWWLAHQAANDPRERWVRQGTDVDVRLFRQISQQLALQHTNSRSDLTIFSTIDSPVLRWYLREFPRYEVGTILPDNPTAQLLITGTDAAAPANYLGTQLGLLRLSLGAQEAEYESDIITTLRWWLFRESRMPFNQQRMTVWLRADLAR